ncbi:MAG: protein-methionine-sulfoxide reductase heme-binding subunit MsrQ [Alteromonadaceae bacterium]|nr:protein-methionine-sulfoxide reductase heme-binding subunit MsrQ [Alteromonadaceae bacterium]
MASLFIKVPTKYKIFILKSLIHFFALLPLINLYYLAVNDNLGADPVEAVIHFTGIGAFNLLLLTLAVSPLAKRFKFGYFMNVRRLLGLYAFAYALCHLFNFVAFDLQFNFNLLVDEIIKRPYITIGLTAFILLTALAVTSVNKIRRRMGKSWQKLHNLNYLIILLVAVHFYWSVKSEIIEPGIYILITLFLLLFRVKFKQFRVHKNKSSSIKNVGNGH